MESKPLSPVKEFAYFIRREAMLLTGKGLAVPTAEVIAPTVEGLVTPAAVEGTGATLGGAANGALLGLITTGLAVAIATGLSLMDYRHKRGVLKELYKDEIAAQLGKSKDKVTVSDLDEVAKRNRVLAQELKRTRRQRNWGIGVAFIATMAAIAFVSAVIAPAAAVAIGSFLGEGLLATVAEVVVHAAAGYAAYKAVEKPVEWVADKAFKIHEKITNDYIIEIERDRAAGKMITREQVLSAFVSANPELDRMIVTNFGKHFDELSVVDKHRAADKVNQIIPLERLTLEINTGVTKPSELAFAVEGKRSGAHHDPNEAQQRHGGLRGMLEDVGVQLEHTQAGRKLENFATKVMAAGENTFITQPGLGQTEQHHTRSFVERLGRGRRGQEVSFAESVEQSRADPALSAQRS